MKESHIIELDATDIKKLIAEKYDVSVEQIKCVGYSYQITKTD